MSELGYTNVTVLLRETLVQLYLKVVAFHATMFIILPETLCNVAFQFFFFYKYQRFLLKLYRSHVNNNLANLNSEVNTCYIHVQVNKNTYNKYLIKSTVVNQGRIEDFFLTSQKPGVRCPAGSAAGTFSLLPSRGVPRLAKTGFPKSCYVPILYFKRLFFKGKLTKILKLKS